jgi:diguanylate cyclase (GGDEF)-like protein
MHREQVMTNRLSSGSQSFEQWNEAQSVQLLFSNAFASVTGSLGVVMVLAWALSTQPVARKTLILWFLGGIIVACSRLAVRWGYFRNFRRWPVQYWLNGYRFFTLTSGILNGLCVVLFFNEVSPAHQLLILFSMAGLTAAATGTHAVDKFTFNSFMYSACIPTLTTLLFGGDPTYYAICLLLFFYILVMGRIGRHTHSTLHENLKMTYKMQYRATHDTLVGLLNREEFENQFEIRRAGSQHGVAILFIDLDNFKLLNDLLGHQAGDQALIRVSNIIRESVRDDDIAARLGGDEFVTALFLDDPRIAEQIAQNIRIGVKAIPFPTEYDYGGLSASIGVAYHGDRQVSFSKLMRNADLASYESKENGKNQVTVTLVDQDSGNANSGSMSGTRTLREKYRYTPGDE